MDEIFLQSDDAEIIPIIQAEGLEDDSKIKNFPQEIPILPLRNTVLFPQIVIPVSIGRKQSNKLIDDIYRKKGIMGVVAQKDPNKDEPGIDDIYKVGTASTIVKVLQMPDGSTTTILHGKQKFRILELRSTTPYLVAKVEPVIEPEIEESQEFLAMSDSIKDISIKILQSTPSIPNEAPFAIKNIENKSFLLNFTASNVLQEVEDKQKVLELEDLNESSKTLLQLLSKESQRVELKNQIQSKVQVDIDQQQKEFYLSQQLKTIQEELGYTQGGKDVEDLKAKAKRKKWGKETAEVFEKELLRFSRMNMGVPDYNVQLSYLQFFVELPWKRYSEYNINLKNVKKVLDRDHYGMDKIKERIMEFLAVLKLKKDMKAPILCLVGPPGVGKTSFGKSIARAIKRKHARFSLGGMRDEAEIRGHRKTYIGAMPGRILQNISRTKSSNLVMILDEIDKVSNSAFGDPSSALLEVLDPEQNSTFYDNYLETNYDLSKVFFIATANTLSTIHPALLDRMEIIDISGYTIEEKIEIAKRHLYKKLLEEHALKKQDIQFTESNYEFIVDNYTRESGVRTLEKVLAKVVRKVAFWKASEEEYETKLTNETIRKILGPAHLKEKYETNKHAGVAVGLAWTEAGGAILFVESSISKGKGQVKVTGNLGDVMKESTTIATTLLKSRARVFEIDEALFDKWDVHIHVPEGATPKDGPSAGITILTSLVSLFTQKKVKGELAMTGEITLRGDVLAVGGIKEKILAAKRAGINTILLSEKNRKDVEDIKPEYIEKLQFVYVNTIEEVINHSILDEKVENQKELTV